MQSPRERGAERELTTDNQHSCQGNNQPLYSDTAWALRIHCIPTKMPLLQEEEKIV